MVNREGLETTNTEKKTKQKEKGYFDYSLLFVWIFIMLLGYVLLYSASSYMALSKEGDSLYYLKKQVFATIVGLVPLLFCTFIDYRFWKNLSKFAYICSIISVLLVKTPLGIEHNGALRWVGIGSLQFQPAEIVKIGVIMVTAYMLSKCGTNALKNIKTCYKIFTPTLLGTMSIVVLTSNLSSGIIILGIGAVMMIVAGADKKFLLSLVGGGTIGLTLILLISAALGKGFRISRVLVWLNPEEYADSGGYQVMQGLYAIGSGGLFGKGLGNSVQKLGFVPEAANDMIFSIICEELGIFGTVCIILLFIFLIRRMRVVASNAPNLYGSMLVVGVMAQISIQVVLNIAVVTNSMPNTGVSLPFISHGGTSLMFLMAEMGLVFSVSRHVKKIR